MASKKFRRKLKIDFRRRSDYTYSYSLLDRSVKVRTLLKYGGISLAFLLVLLLVFMLGRHSSDAPEEKSVSSQQILSEPEEEVDGTPEAENEAEAIGEAKPEAFETPEIEETPVQVVEDTREVFEAPPCKNKVAGFDYNYTKINISVSNFIREIKGDNWAVISAIKLTVSNNEKCLIVNPAQIKIKLNPKGKGSIWWDDEVYLPESFRKLMPGTVVTEVVPIHVAYSDIYGEKDLKVVLYDEYDIPMATYRTITKIV